MYREYKRQDDALLEHRMVPGSMIMASDVEEGKAFKKFVVATTDEFWKRYRRPGARRSHYEILVTDQPCKFYMDIDVALADVPAEFDGHEVVEEIKRTTRMMFQRLLGIDESDTAVQLFETDSSNHKKFSRHLVYDLGAGRAMMSNAHCGAFCRHIERHLIERYGPPEQNRFWFRDSANVVAKHQPMIDAGVYTKNRNFRLYRSSKLGQNRYLCRVGTAAQALERHSNEEPLDVWERDFLFSSLIQRFDGPGSGGAASAAPTILLQIDEPTGERALYTSKTWWSMKRQMESYGKRVDPGHEAFDRVAVLNRRSAAGGGGESQLEGRVRYRTGDPTQGVVSESDEWSATTIPLIVRELGDRLLATSELSETLERTGGIQYYYWLPDSMMLVCQFQGTYCHLAGRKHGSNHAMVVLRLRDTPRYWHKCNSQACPVDSNHKIIGLVSSDPALGARVHVLRDSHERAQQRSFEELFRVLCV